MEHEFDFMGMHPKMQAKILACPPRTTDEDGHCIYCDADVVCQNRAYHCILCLAHMETIKEIARRGGGEPVDAAALFFFENLYDVRGQKFLAAPFDKVYEQLVIATNSILALDNHIPAIMFDMMLSMIMAEK